MLPIVSFAKEYAHQIVDGHAAQSLGWQIAQLQMVVRRHGIDERHDKSNFGLVVRSDRRTLSVPAHRPIKPIYVREFIELLVETAA